MARLPPGYTDRPLSGTIIGTMSNRVIVACGVIAAAAVSMLVRARRRNGASTVNLVEEESGLEPIRTFEIGDDEAAEIISRARPALDRAAKLL